MQEMREKAEQGSVVSTLATKGTLIDVVRYCSECAHTHILTQTHVDSPMQCPSPACDCCVSHTHTDTHLCTSL